MCDKVFQQFNGIICHVDYSQALILSYQIARKPHFLKELTWNVLGLGSSGFTKDATLYKIKYLTFVDVNVDIHIALTCEFTSSSKLCWLVTKSY